MRVFYQPFIGLFLCGTAMDPLMISRAAFLISPLWAEEEIIGSRGPDFIILHYCFDFSFIPSFRIFFLVPSFIYRIKKREMTDDYYAYIP